MYAFAPGATTIKLREGSDVYHLACYLHSRAEHANDCRFCAPALQRSDLQGYAVSVVEETADGGMKVRLARGVRQQAPREAGDAAPCPPADLGVKKPANDAPGPATSSLIGKPTHHLISGNCR